MSEFSYSTPLSEDGVPTWILLFMTGVIFQIKKELPSLHSHRLARIQTPCPLLELSITQSVTFTCKA